MGEIQPNSYGPKLTEYIRKLNLTHTRTSGRGSKEFLASNILKYLVSVRAAVQNVSVAEYLAADGSGNYVAVLNDMDGGVYIIPAGNPLLDLLQEHFHWDGNGNFEHDIMVWEGDQTQILEYVMKGAPLKGNVQDPDFRDVLDSISFFCTQKSCYTEESKCGDGRHETAE